VDEGPAGGRAASGLGVFQRLETVLGTPALSEPGVEPLPPGPLQSVGWVVIHFTRNLGRVLLTALPLMLLAGWWAR
jgi:hypothetical protein